MGQYTANGYLYKPSYGETGRDTTSKFNGGLDLVDAYMADQAFVPWDFNTYTLADFVTQIGSDPATIVFPTTTINIDDDTTVPSNIVLSIPNGSILNVADNMTLTINGPIDAGPYQIFSWTGTGNVEFGNGAVKEVYAEWWGAKADDSTDCLAAFTAALTSHPNVVLDAGTYQLSSTLVGSALDNRVIRGVGSSSVLHFTPGCVGIKVGNYWTIRDCVLQGHAKTYAAGGHWAIQALYNGTDPANDVNRSMESMGSSYWQGAHVTIKNVTIYNWEWGGINLGPYSTVENTFIYDVFSEGILTQGSYSRIVDNVFKNTASWAIDLNGANNLVQGNYIYNCGDYTALDDAGLSGDDAGGIVSASATLAVGNHNNKIVNNTIELSDGPGIKVNISWDGYTTTGAQVIGNTVKNVLIDNTDGNVGGITIADDSSTGSKLFDVVVTDNIVNTVNGSNPGINVAAATRVKVANNLVQGTAGRGIWVWTLAGHNPSLVMVSGNSIKSFHDEAIALQNTDQVTVIGNNISGSANDASFDCIKLDGSTNYVVNSNQIVGSKTAPISQGIRITGASAYGTVVGNTVKSTDAAIYYDATGNYCNIVGNDLTNDNASTIYRGGTKTVVIQQGNLGVAVPEYADNTAAAAALPVGEFYRLTGTDHLAVVH